RESLEAVYEFRCARPAHQYCTNATLLDEPHATKDECSHHDLAYLGGADHECTDVRRIERKRRTSFGPSAGGRKCRGASELAHLARELSGAEGGDCRFVIEAVATCHSDGSLEYEPGRHIGF